MRHERHFRAPRCRAHCRDRESRFAALASCEYDFPPRHKHPVQLRRVIQAQQAAAHLAVCRKFAKHSRQMPAGALHSAGRVQLGEQSNDHAPSLTTAAPERKPPNRPGSVT
jgi:hypothetical protein